MGANAAATQIAEDETENQEEQVAQVEETGFPDASTYEEYEGYNNGYYDENGEWVEATGYYDENGEWVEQSGYYDENGDWVETGGYYDENGEYIEYAGYYDENGEWVEVEPPASYYEEGVVDTGGGEEDTGQPPPPEQEAETQEETDHFLAHAGVEVQTVQMEIKNLDDEEEDSESQEFVPQPSGQSTPVSITEEGGIQSHPDTEDDDDEDIDALVNGFHHHHHHHQKDTEDEMEIKSPSIGDASMEDEQENIKEDHDQEMRDDEEHDEEKAIKEEMEDKVPEELGKEEEKEDMSEAKVKKQMSEDIEDPEVQERLATILAKRAKNMGAGGSRWEALGQTLKHRKEEMILEKVRKNRFFMVLSQHFLLEKTGVAFGVILFFIYEVFKYVSN